MKNTNEMRVMSISEQTLVFAISFDHLSYALLVLFFCFVLFLYFFIYLFIFYFVIFDDLQSQVHTDKYDTKLMLIEMVLVLLVLLTIKSYQSIDYIKLIFLLLTLNIHLPVALAAIWKIINSISSCRKYNKYIHI